MEAKIQNFITHISNSNKIKYLTTNFDNNKAPIHRWFPFLFGFSNNLVRETFQYFSLKNDSLVFDPFMGSGTTGVIGRELDVNVVGNEINPFLHKICKIKTNTEVDVNTLLFYSDLVYDKSKSEWHNMNVEDVQSSICKCYDEENLKKLISLRNNIMYDTDIPELYRSYLFMLVTMMLPQTASVGINVPYISYTHKRKPLECFSVYERNLEIIVSDLQQTYGSYDKGNSIDVFLHDSRNKNDDIENTSVDMIFTSPPYLNNFDYGESLKIFLYFWKLADDWNDITKTIREPSLVSSTTHYKKGDYVSKSDEDILGDEFIANSPNMSDKIINDVHLIRRKINENKRRKKTFDILTLLYFKDMFNVINEMYRVVKEQSASFIIIGDSAPYGVHISTDTYIGEMSIECGFKSYTLIPIRKRGHKWKSLRYRHNKELRECILILRK